MSDQHVIVPAWRSLAGGIAGLVILAQALWRGVLLGRGYFSQGDFVLLAETRRFGWHTFAEADRFGGYTPGAELLALLETRIDSLGWPLAVAGTLLLQAAAAVLLWLVLNRLLGKHWARLPLFVAGCFAPLTLWSTQWWSMALVFWPATICLLLAAWATLVAVQSGDGRWRVLVPLAVLVALAFSERAVLQPVLLVAVALLAHLRAGPSRGAWRRAARAERGVWLALVALLAGYVALRWAVAPIDPGEGVHLGDVVTTYLRHTVGGLAGGPWVGDLPGHAFVLPKSWAVAANAALFLALMAVTLQHGGVRARLAWAAFVLHLLLGTGLLALIGQRDMLASLGLVPAFAADVVPVAVVCAAGALSDVSLSVVRLGDREIGGPWLAPAVGATTAVLFTLSAAFSTVLLAPNLYHRDDRSYVEQVRKDLRRTPQVVLLDRGVPEGVVSPWYAERARLSTVLAVAPEHPIFDLPSHELRMVTDEGRMVPVGLEGVIRIVESGDTSCGYRVRATGTTIGLQATVPPGRWVLRIGYYTNADTFGTVVAGDESVRFPVRNGLQAVDVPLSGTFGELEVSIEDAAATMCLASGAVGTAVPDEVG